MCSKRATKAEFILPHAYPLYIDPPETQNSRVRNVQPRQNLPYRTHTHFPKYRKMEEFESLQKTKKGEITKVISPFLVIHRRLELRTP